jgi:hypothetical protein
MRRGTEWSWVSVRLCSCTALVGMGTRTELLQMATSFLGRHGELLETFKHLVGSKEAPTGTHNQRE